MNTTNRSAQIAETLLEIEAVFLRPEDPFTWASGIKSPIYCDNRVSLSYPKARDLIRDSFVDLIQEQYPGLDAVAGVATAGIPHASLIADKMQIPMCYVRSSSKGHGRTNQIEGKLERNFVAIANSTNFVGTAFNLCACWWRNKSDKFYVGKCLG